MAQLPEKKVKIPEGLWVKCDNCKEIIYKKEIDRNLKVCPKCDYHFRISASERLALVVDEGSFVELDQSLSPVDFLEFKDTVRYKDKIKKSQSATGLKDAVIVAEGRIDYIPAIVAAMEYGFIGGSMGVVVGEKIARGIDRALEHRLPVVIVSCSGGARMMEGALSLMQMAKICAGLAQMDKAGLPYLSVLTDPTTGGVTASFAMLGDLNIAEPKALIGFAGPRVIEQTIRQKLPEGFQRSEFLLDRGMLDMVVDRRDLKSLIARALRFMSDAPAAPVRVPAPAAAPAEAAAASENGAPR